MSVTVGERAERYLADFVSRRRDFVRAWLEAAPHHCGGALANRLGWQVMRALLAQFRYALRPRHAHRELAHYEAALAESGIAVITDFLTDAEFADVKSAYDAFGRSAQVKCALDRNGTGVDWYTGRIDCGRESSEAERVLTAKLARDPMVTKLAEHVLRRRLPKPPTLSYQRLVVRPGFVDDKDFERVLHADRHYHCVKMAYHLRPTAEAQGAYVFCPGSHRVTCARLRHEYEYSVRQARLKKLGEEAIDPSLLRLGRNLVSDRAQREMGLRPTSIDVPGNTLVVSDNRGFHARGTIEPGQERHQIRIVFYYAQVPLWTRLALAIVGKKGKRWATGQFGA